MLPNLLLNLHPDYMMTLHPVAAGVPTAPTSSASGTSIPTPIAQPGFDPSGAIEFWDITNRQDWELSDLAQRGHLVAGLPPGPYSNREELLHALDAWVVERLGGA